MTENCRFSICVISANFQTAHKALSVRQRLSSRIATLIKPGTAFLELQGPEGQSRAFTFGARSKILEMRAEAENSTGIKKFLRYMILSARTLCTRGQLYELHGEKLLRKQALCSLRADWSLTAEQYAQIVRNLGLTSDGIDTLARTYSYPFSNCITFVVSEAEKAGLPDLPTRKRLVTPEHLMHELTKTGRAYKPIQCL